MIWTAHGGHTGPIPQQGEGRANTVSHVPALFLLLSHLQAPSGWTNSGKQPLLPSLPLLLAALPSFPYGNSRLSVLLPVGPPPGPFAASSNPALTSYELSAQGVCLLPSGRAHGPGKGTVTEQRQVINKAADAGRSGLLGAAGGRGGLASALFCPPSLKHLHLSSLAPCRPPDSWSGPSAS